MMKYVIVTIIAAVPLTWIAGKITGSMQRAYRVLGPDDSIQLVGQSIKVHQAVEYFKPCIYDLPYHSPPKPNVMWYQVAPHENGLTFIYHPTWFDEQHPDPVMHIIYRWYRQSRYGSAQDLEYIEITVDPGTKRMTRVRFETAGPDAEYNLVLPHLDGYIEHTGEGYSLNILTPERIPVVPEQILEDDEWLTEDRRVKLAVQTWNHVYQLVPVDRGMLQLDMPLKFMDEKTYRRFKIARRSQGDYSTHDDWRIIPVVALVLMVILLGLTYFVGSF